MQKIVIQIISTEITNRLHKLIKMASLIQFQEEKDIRKYWELDSQQQ